MIRTTGHFSKVKQYLKRLIPIALVIFVSLGCPSSNGKPPPQELRAIWVWTRTNNAQKIDEMLDRVVRGGFDTVLYYVGSGMVHYNSALLPQSPDVTPDYDPLAYAVEQGHARGLKVQAWWCPGTTPWNSSFRSRYPEWSIASVPGIDHNWLNFSLPEARQFVGDVVVEIAENYDVDGVHLDYIRYPSPPPYTDVDCREFFSPDDVSATVQGVYRRLKASRPNVQLTAAVLAGLTAPENALQHWGDWLAGEYIDTVMPMAHVDSDKNDHLRRYIREWQAKPHSERIVPGLNVNDGEGKDSVLKTPEQLLAQVELCKAGGAKGITIFAERSITEELLDALASVTFSP